MDEATRQESAQVGILALTGLDSGPGAEREYNLRADQIAGLEVVPGTSGVFVRMVGSAERLAVKGDFEKLTEEWAHALAVSRLRGPIGGS